MNRQGWLVIAVVVAGMGLGGCASQAPKYAKRDLGAEVDEAKVVSVNEWGRTHGAVIRWVNMPVKKPGAAGN